MPLDSPALQAQDLHVLAVLTARQEDASSYAALASGRRFRDLTASLDRLTQAGLILRRRVGNRAAMLGVEVLPRGRAYLDKLLAAVATNLAKR